MRNFAIAFSVMVIAVWIILTAVNHPKKNTVRITEQDIVRYCLDRRASHAPEAETHWACREMGGDYYIANGVKPNYDKYPSWKTWGLKEEPR